MRYLTIDMAVVLIEELRSNGAKASENENYSDQARVRVKLIDGTSVVR